MLEHILDYVSGWSPGLHSGVFRELGLTVSSKLEHWYAAFERHVALGQSSSDAVSAYATSHADDVSILTWNLRASQSCHTAGHDLLPAQLQVPTPRTVPTNAPLPAGGVPRHAGAAL